MNALPVYALLSIVVLLPTVSAQQRSIRRLDGSKISIAEAQAFATKTLAAAQVTGAQIAILNRGKLVWSAAFGLRQLAPELPMNRETTTWVASVTKSVFATYVMQLVEHGEFSLDIPIATHTPPAAQHLRTLPRLSLPPGQRSCLAYRNAPHATRPQLWLNQLCHD